jgi:hypothetical protein
MRYKRRLIMGAIVLTSAGTELGVFGSATVAIATPPPVTYTACVSTIGGVLYKVTTNGMPKCLDKDQSITWNSTGLQGPIGPAGPTLPGTIYGAQELVGSLDPTNPDQTGYIEDCPTGQVAIAGSAWFLASGGGDAVQPLVAQIAETNQFMNSLVIHISQYAGTAGVISWNITCAYVAGVADVPQG